MRDEAAPTRMRRIVTHEVRELRDFVGCPIVGGGSARIPTAGQASSGTRHPAGPTTQHSAGMIRVASPFSAPGILLSVGYGLYEGLRVLELRLE